MSLAGISIRRPVATTMVMVSFIFIGLLAMFSMKKELIPNINIPVVTISTTWNGAVAEDVETQVTKKIKDSLSNVEAIDKIQTVSAYGVSTVVVNFDYGVDTDEKVTQIQREVSKITNDLPSDANTPLVRKFEAAGGNMTAIIAFNADSKTALTTFIKEQLKPRLESLPGIGQVDIFGNPDKQLQIQVDSDKLASYNLSPMELYNIVRTSVATYPIGKLSTGNKDMIIRFMGDLDYIDQYKNILISSNGNTLRLKDVADVVLTTEDADNVGYLNGKESVVVLLQKSSDGDTITLNNAAFKVIEEMRPYMPAGTEYSIEMDSSENINNSISNVSSSAVQGLVLATIILFVFLKSFRTTVLISLALPVAIVFTFAFLAMRGATLNLISLMGLSIGVGMLTDNSVVVVDNIYRHITELNSPVREAAENATEEVTFSVIASALTTIVVFLPILFIPGLAREFFRDMSYAIIFSNLAAIIVAITLIPMLASRFLNRKSMKSEDGKFFKKVKAFYLKVINSAVSHKGLTVLIMVGLFFFSILVGPKLLKFEFMPKQDEGKYSMTAELQKGTDLAKAERIAKELEEIVKNDPHTESYLMLVSTSSISINVNVGKKNTRKDSVFTIMDDIRKKASNVLDARVSMTNQFSGRQTSKDIEFLLQGSNQDEIKKFGKQLLEKLQSYDGMVDISSTLDPGIIELRLNIDRDKIASYGISPTVIAQTISYYMLGGDKANTATLKTDTEEIDVLVRLPKEKRNDINTLSSLNIKVGDNKFVKLSDVATLQYAEGTSEVRKKNGIYTVTISGNDGGVGLGKIQSKIIEEFNNLEPPSTISYSWGGQSENMQKTMSQLSFALSISIFLIYVLLASQFESFILPFIIIGSIPLALIGVIWGLVVLRQPIDIMVMIGVILLAGVVVNNAIVLIDFIKTMRTRGYDKEYAIIYSCETRLRPILMTTMTTVFGMIPMALGLGEGSEFYRGMAITVIFGLAFSTILTLVLIPILYSVVDSFTTKMVAKLKEVFGSLKKKGAK
ncbi:efflux RND transporter permease subunit [Fusobacterium pseudoperiodonticum]|uniref:efflux RND transporter permease subunit n=1 Tax=Fusobacterium pseudoperiodonticum TaxID=2663009 RepID=UPI000C1B9E6D|nr:efflux RND transporter permease subunit [Fusobacterium pseudoperiodonticum]ATV63301.1 acriflavin resistance protein [Fusobacterium pseudoperiodonticum]ATV67730.1 AcrB/AcrD/AcrF family protein [Fusobacterium pseudoperiodonticum]